MNSGVGRVVLVSYYFPPLIGIASERAASMSNHLCAIGWDVSVVTAASGHFDSVAEDVPLRARVVRTRSLELSRLLRRGYRAATGATGAADEEAGLQPLETGSVGGRLRRLARDWLYVPDAQVGWIPFASRAVGGLLGGGSGPRVVFSSSVPYSAHIAAMRAARRLGVPWVAEFRDPWTIGRASDQLRSSARNRVDRRLEHRILLGADHVVVTAPALRTAILEGMPQLTADRISVVTNGFEAAPPGVPPGPGEPMTIVYAGSVAAGEDVGPVLDALDAVEAADPGSFLMRVVGPPAPWRARGDRSWLALDGIVSPRAARAAMTDASALLLSQRHPAYRDVLPGKTFEYAGARRPVLALVPPGSDMETILREHADARLVDPRQPQGLTAAVQRLIREHRAGELQAPRVPETVTAPLQRRAQAEKLGAILERVGSA